MNLLVSLRDDGSIALEADSVRGLSSGGVMFRRVSDGLSEVVWTRFFGAPDVDAGVGEVLGVRGRVFGER